MAHSMGSSLLASHPQVIVQRNGQGDEGVLVPGFLPEQEFVLQVLAQPLQENSPKFWLSPPQIHCQSPELHREVPYEAVSLAEG